MKRFLSKLFVVMLVLSMMVNVLVVNAKIEDTLVSEDYFVSSVGAGGLEQYVDLDEFKAYLLNRLYAYDKNIAIASFNIPFTQEMMNAIGEFVRGGIPEAFHISSSIGGSGYSVFTSISVTYLYTEEEFLAMKEELDVAVEEMISGIAENDSLGEAEKALLLHDRLALRCEYDYTYSKRDSYQAIVKGTSVCEGYAKAYSLLLDKVGIKSEYCGSDALNHAWNIVYVGGKPYHVDVTWDDVAWAENERGVLGMVQHENFLRSTNGIKETNHTASDFKSTPVDTTYDKAFWQTSESAFVLLGDEIYYLDEATASLSRYSDKKALCSIDDMWMAGQSSYWVGNYSRLTTDGKYLYYSLSDAVYKYDVKSGSCEKVFEPSLKGLEAIYGLDYIDGYLVADISTAPPYSNGTLSQQSYLLPRENEESIVIKKESTLAKESGYLSGVEEQTTVADLLSQFENEDVVVYSKDGVILKSDYYCTTGCKVVLEYGDEVVEKLTVVVLGDVDGSGSVNTTDYAQMKAVLSGKITVKNEFFKASDVDEDGNLSTTDFLRIKMYFLGLYELYA